MRREGPLLARYAEGLFWMARYLERVENLARLLDVTQTFENPGREDESWSAILRINADDEKYAEAGMRPTAEAVKRFYLLDRKNTTGIPNSLEAARTNARTLRPIISTEMWTQLNVFHRDMLSIREEELQGDRLSRLCTRIKQGVQAHTGITEGTFFRDQGWFFYQMGRLIERADQTTRLVDIRFHLLVPAGGEELRVAELTQWGGVLRAGAGYHAFRRVSQAGFTPADVVRFLLTDGSFPRSVALCLTEIEGHLTQLRTRYGLRGTVKALERVEELRAGLLGRSVKRLIEGGLHAFLDGVQRDLIMLAGEIGTAFFRDWRPLDKPEGAAPEPVVTRADEGEPDPSHGSAQADPDKADSALARSGQEGSGLGDRPPGQASPPPTPPTSPPAEAPHILSQNLGLSLAEISVAARERAMTQSQLQPRPASSVSDAGR